MEAGEVDPRFRYQGGQAGDEVQGFEDDVGDAIAVRCANNREIITFF